MKLRTVLLAATMGVLPAAVSAQPVDGLYIGLMGGYNIVQDSDLKFSPPRAGTNEVEFDGGWAVIGRIGWGFGEVAPGIGRRGMAPRGVKAAAILKPEGRVEAEEVGRAGRPPGAGDSLVGVVEIGKGKGMPRRHLLHARQGVLGIGGGIVGTDRTHPDPERQQLARIAQDPVQYRQHVGTVVADEHHQCSARPGDVTKAARDAGSVAQHEGRSFPAEIADRR